MKKLIAPSILSADFSNLKKEIEMINESEADWFHIDVMDGKFVPNITFGMPVIKSIKKHANKPFDVHLMIENPENFIKDFKESGADILTVHYEACTHLHRTIQQIKEQGMKCGVAINPSTSTSLLKDIIREIDLVCIMSVNPGFGGQKFIKNTYKKIEEIREISKYNNENLLIEIDGGVSNENASYLFHQGADVLVSGSFIFKSDDPMNTICNLKNS